MIMWCFELCRHRSFGYSERIGHKSVGCEAQDPSVHLYMRSMRLRDFPRCKYKTAFTGSFRKLTGEYGAYRLTATSSFLWINVHQSVVLTTRQRGSSSCTREDLDSWRARKSKSKNFLIKSPSGIFQDPSWLTARKNRFTVHDVANTYSPGWML